MGRVDRVIPEESAILCEGCGYIVSGLPMEGRCPECGRPIIESAGRRRGLPEWESAESARPRSRRFWATTLAVIFRPTRFYQTLATRADPQPSRTFAQIHMGITSLLLGLGVLLHARWMLSLPGFASIPEAMRDHPILSGLEVAGTFVLAYLALYYTTALGCRLTVWEAAYRGLRLPQRVVMRALDYHAAHYLPVALLGLLTVAGYQYLLGAGYFTALSGPRYLYVLSIEILLSAGYLFKTYWMGMRNIMYANR